MRWSSTSSIITATSPLFLACPAFARPAGIWQFDIWEGPAPPPDQGPPLSAGALRDRSKLKYEVIGIVGAYVVWLLATFVLILFVGTRLRRKTQTSNRTLSMEMIKAGSIPQPPIDVEPPLRSPGKLASLKAWATGGKNHSQSQSSSHSHKPSNVSVSTVDTKVVEADKVKNLDEMAKLYAAVMAHDEEKAQKATSSSGQTTPKSTGNPPPQYHAPPTPKLPQYPVPVNAGLPQSPRSPRHAPEFQHVPPSPRSPQQPPEFQHLRHRPPPPQFEAPLAPTPVDDLPSSTSASRPSSRRTKASPLSFISAGHGRTNSSNSDRPRPQPISVRGLPISQPLGSADLRGSSTYSEDSSFTPRIYTPGPPPPTPGPKSDAVQVTEVEKKAEAVEVVELGEKKKVPAPLSLRSAAASSSSHTLPFRQYYAESMKSAPATKTTFVDRRESILGYHPKTGMPQTPYSPYMPFTPMTPVTPRTLMTKKEMKKNKKKEGLKVVSEDDMVMSDEDMWGSVK